MLKIYLDSCCYGRNSGTGFLWKVSFTFQHKLIGWLPEKRLLRLMMVSDFGL